MRRAGRGKCCPPQPKLAASVALHSRSSRREGFFNPVKKPTRREEEAARNQPASKPAQSLALTAARLTRSRSLPGRAKGQPASHGHRQPVQRGGGGRRQRGEHEGATLGARQPAPSPRRRARRAPRPAAARHRRGAQPRPHPLRRPQRGGGAGVHAGDRVAPAADHGRDPGARAQDLLRQECGGEDAGGGGGSQGEDLRGGGRAQGRSARHGVPCVWPCQEDVLG